MARSRDGRPRTTNGSTATEKCATGAKERAAGHTATSCPHTSKALPSMRHYAAADKMQEYATVFFREEICRGSCAPATAPIQRDESRIQPITDALHAGLPANPAILPAAPPLRPLRYRSSFRPRPRPPRAWLAAHAGISSAADRGPLAFAAAWLRWPRRRRSSSAGFRGRAGSEVGAPRARPPAPIRRAGALVCGPSRLPAPRTGSPRIVSSSPAGARLRPAPSSARLAVGCAAVVIASARGGSPPSPRAACRPPPFPRRACGPLCGLSERGAGGSLPGPAPSARSSRA